MHDNEAQLRIWLFLASRGLCVGEKVICQIMPRRSRLGLQKLCFKLQRFMQKEYKRRCTSSVKLNTAKENQVEGEKTAQLRESQFRSSSKE